MKKIYVTSLLTFATASLFAQQQQSVEETKFGIKPKHDSEVLINRENSSAVNRGSAFWTEDFANGLSGNNLSTVQTWTVDGTEGSVWKHDFYGSSGCWSFNTVTPPFTTVANGFMLFDADSLNCLDASTTPNPTMVSPLITPIGGLISPTIDLSSQPSVLLNFDHSFRYCCNANLTLYVYVSDDDGATWSTPINVFNGSTPAVNAQSAPNPMTTSINITALTNSSATVKIKFEWGGVTHYYWAIDDIALTPAAPYDVRLNTSLFHNATKEPVMDVFVEHTVVPANLIDVAGVSLKGLLDNQGSNAATNASLSYSVVDGALNAAGAGNSTPVNLAPATTRNDSTGWMQSATPETYTITYMATHDDTSSEADLTDNELTATVITTASSGTGAQYARDNNVATGSGLWNGAGNGYIMGNSFHVNTNTTLYSIDVAFTPSTDAGVVACAILYEIDPGTGDFNPVADMCLDGVEYTLQAANISANNTMVWNKFPVNPTAPLTGYALTAGTTYIAAISHYGGTEDMVVQAGGGSADNFATWLFDQTDATWYYMTTRPKIRMGMDPAGLLGVEEVEMTNLSLSQNVPNPAAETSTISYSLTESANVTFEVVDVTGKVIYTENMGNKGAGVYSLTLNTAEYANGIYYYTMNAGAEKITKKMIVTK